MTVNVWEPGKLYNPGATVRPATVAPVESPTIPNGNFESGNTQWTTETNWSIAQKGTDSHAAFDGTWAAKYSGTGASEGRIKSQTVQPVRPGQSIKASCMVRQGDSNAGNAGARVELEWLDASQVLIFRSQGTLIDAEPKNKWVKSEVEASAPAGAAYVRPVGYAFRAQGNSPLWIDTFVWNYSYSPVNAGLVFTAVQSDAGFSAGTEPIWPDTAGVQVVDNEVIWEAVDGSRVVWEANPILVSDYYEPDFPLDVGANVVDNTIIWTAVSRQVTDEKCPHSPIVAIATSKVFAGDDDIIAFSATVNPLDWSTAEDAGYLPFGLQNFGAMPVKALGLYRGNLVAFNSQGYQVWQIGEDPDTHALLDGGPIGCIWPRTVLPVMNDLVFLSAVGVRNLGIAGASQNLQSGNWGQAIDALVTEKLRDDDPYSSEDDPLGLYLPAYGQYWLIFGAEAFVLTINGNKEMSWSRYTFPEAITDWTLENDDLLLRTENHRVWRVSDEALLDDIVTAESRILTVGHGTDNGADVYGYDARAAIDNGIVGSPFGDLESNLLTDVVSVIYLEWSTDEGSGDTTLQIGITQNGFEPPEDIFDSFSFTDDANRTFTFLRSESLEPVGQTGTYAGGDLKYWLFTLTNDPGPDTTVGEEYAITFDLGAAYDDGGNVDIVGVIQWPHLDCGSFGVEKQFVGFDLVATASEGVSVSVCYDQRDPAVFTTPYVMDDDSLPGKLVPIPVSAPSFALRLEFAPNQRWEWEAAAMYVNDLRDGA